MHPSQLGQALARLGQDAARGELQLLQLLLALEHLLDGILADLLRLGRAVQGTRRVSHLPGHRDGHLIRAPLRLLLTVAVVRLSRRLPALLLRLRLVESLPVVYGLLLTVPVIQHHLMPGLLPLVPPREQFLELEHTVPVLVRRQTLVPLGHGTALPRLPVHLLHDFHRLLPRLSLRQLHRSVLLLKWPVPSPLPSLTQL